MALLYYWKREQFTKDNQNPPGEGELELSQNADVLRNAANERMWVISCDYESHYVLVGQVFVEIAEERGSQYGRYTVRPRPGSTVRYRLVNPIPDVEGVVRQLSFRPTARVLGTVFEGDSAVRKLDDADDRLLATFAASLRPASAGFRWKLAGTK